jgi:hypothetical protein
MNAEVLTQLHDVSPQNFLVFSFSVKIERENAITLIIPNGRKIKNTDKEKIVLFHYQS